MSTLEARAYSRGYYSGKLFGFARVDKVVAIARAYRLRLLTTQRERFGDSNWMSRTCINCYRWTRGTPGSCKWGKCAADFMTEVGEPSMHSDADIITWEDFGCVNWLHPDHPTRNLPPKSVSHQ